MSFERDNIRAMHGYASGEQPEDPRTIKLNTNENPYPPSPKVAEALAGISERDLRRYPPPHANAFRDLAARLHGLERDNVIATRGGDELLRLVITTFVDPGQMIAVTEPTYSLYPVLARIQDAGLASVPLGPDFSLPADFADSANAAGARVSFLVNPHAPSGHLLDVDTIERVASRLDGLLLLDEAYVDFIDPAFAYDSVTLVRELDNVIILRTLSKGYSLAGLRFGYGMAPAALIEPMLTKTRDSYNLDTISQRLAVAALEDQDWARASWVKVRDERDRLTGELCRLGFSVSPSQSNFLLATAEGGPSPAKALYEGLKARGILIRYFDTGGLADKLRITVGTPEENDRLLLELENLVKMTLT